MSRLLRSLIFVPGNNPKFLEKAKKLNADIVCFDLEDSVPKSEKKNARKLIAKALSSKKESLPEVYVRTNSPSSKEIVDDLESVVRNGIDGIVIPKVNNVKEVKKIEKILTRLERKKKLKPIELVPSIESAEGVVNCFAIASSSKRISAVVFGVFDLLNEMGIEYTKNPIGAQYARAKIALDAKAAGIYSIDAIWQDLKDLDGLKEDCITGRNLGYSGKSIIHPEQIEIAHAIFYPNKAEIEWAQKVYDAYLKSEKVGRGATSIEGKMIDEVHFKRAKTVLDLAKKK